MPMAPNPTSTPSRSRFARRYAILLAVVLALVVGWIGFWNYAAGEVQVLLDGWRAREAKAGRVYACGSQSVGGFPFRFELDCAQASALFRGTATPLKVETKGLLLVAQVYQPTLLIGEYTGPLTVTEPGEAQSIVVNWKLAQSSLRGTPQQPERAALVLDAPEIDRIAGADRQVLLRAKHVEMHGRILGSVAAKPVIELALELDQATLPALHQAAPTPFNANMIVSLRGLGDFSPKPWPARFREIQAAGGRIDIDQVRLRQGDSVAVGKGSLSLNADGRLQGELRMTVAGVESFLSAIGARQMVQNSASMDKIAGMLDRLSPGLGNAARQQAGANIALGLNLIGQPTTLEGKPALTLPLRFEDGAMFLGPIPLGIAPALF
jgi:hypothetical protein